MGIVQPGDTTVPPRPLRRRPPVHPPGLARGAGKCLSFRENKGGPPASADALEALLKEDEEWRPESTAEARAVVADGGPPLWKRDRPHHGTSTESQTSCVPATASRQPTLSGTGSSSGAKSSHRSSHHAKQAQCEPVRTPPQPGLDRLSGTGATKSIRTNRPRGQAQGVGSSSSSPRDMHVHLQWHGKARMLARSMSTQDERIRSSHHRNFRLELEESSVEHHVLRKVLLKVTELV